MKVRRDLINSVTPFQVIVQFVVGAAGVSMCEHWLSLRHNCNKLTGIVIVIRQRKTRETMPSQK